MFHYTYLQFVSIYTVPTLVCTEKPVYKDHPRGQVIVVFVDRWSYVEVQQYYFSGSRTSLQWSLWTGGPSTQVVFKTGFTVYVLCLCPAADPNSI